MCIFNLIKRLPSLRIDCNKAKPGLSWLPKTRRAVWCLESMDAMYCRVWWRALNLHIPFALSLAQGPTWRKLARKKSKDKSLQIPPNLLKLVLRLIGHSLFRMLLQTDLAEACRAGPADPRHSRRGTDTQHWHIPCHNSGQQGDRGELQVPWGRLVIPGSKITAARPRHGKPSSATDPRGAGGSS